MAHPAADPTPLPYRPVPTVPDRVALEHEVLRRWEERNVFARLRDRNRGGQPFSFLDGPITANNPMGVHHAWGRTLKDLIQRFHAMDGRDLRWQNGFDCQGLWVEVEVEKALGFDSKREIEAFGLDRFSRVCRDRVTTYAARIAEQSRRLGMWMDWDRSYFTMADTNISYIWTFLAECHRRGWLYRGHRLMPWCYRCGTSLSHHELADSYSEVTHPSVFVRLPLDGADDEWVAVWTTTPWTLPANVAVAVAPAGAYVLVDTGAGKVWVAESQLDVTPVSGRIVKAATGAELAGRKYLPPLEGLDAQHNAVHEVVSWADVSLDEGTGFVHIAPGCGAEDFELGRELGLAVLAPLDEAGFYVDGYGDLSGTHVSEANPTVVSELRAADKLIEAATLSHRYPTCWRCGTELVHRVVDEWFISAAAVREPMRAAAATVEWQPAHAAKRMDDWLANMGDWCISRKRYWGLPLPFFHCASGHLTVVESKDDLLHRAVRGADELSELHRPWIDEVAVACAVCGAESVRVPDVGDCWLDAGIVAFSTLGWHNRDAVPRGYGTGAGEGATLADLPDHGEWERWFPADLVCEMHEQLRLWFYSLLFMSVVLDGRAPYRKVLTYDRVNDERGREMHKSWGNAVWFDDAVETMGADTMRWLYASHPPGRDLNFGYRAGEEAARRFLTFWNTYAFFVTYANLDGFQPPPGLAGGEPSSPHLALLDRWLIARTRQLVIEMREAIASTDTPRATGSFEAFSADLSNWYVRLSRDRFWGNESSADKEAAYQTLWWALVTAARCLAPTMPFVADEIWDNLTGSSSSAGDGSVHLAGFPRTALAAGEVAELDEMRHVRAVVEIGRSARSAADLRRRQPLPALFAVHADPAHRAAVERHAELVKRECNVKRVDVLESADDLTVTEVAPNFRVLGPKFRSDADTIARLLQAGEYQPDTAGYRVGEWLLDEGDVVVRMRARPDLAVSEGDGWVVALDTTVTPELVREGRARDAVRAIQQARKDLDLAITDRIAVTYPAADADVFDPFGSWIAEQTLAVSLTPGDALRIQPLRVPQ